MSSSTMLVGVRPDAGTEDRGESFGSEAQTGSAAARTAPVTAKLGHSRSCPALQIRGACEPWCHAFPCPSWCTGVHRAGNRLYHLAAPCPSSCTGHPNGETDHEHAHDARRAGAVLALIVKIKRVRS
jgi:hypothetical protein